MSFFFIVLIICLVLFLFRLYHVANDDYVLVKKNVSLDEVFNCAFVCGLIALLFARIFYVILNPNPIFFSPLGFLIFPYFPGLSLFGGLIGGIIALFIYSRVKKFPLGRIFDFFAVSFTFILPVGLLGYFLLSQEFSIGGTVKLVLFLIIAFAANLYLHPKASSLEIRDGSISILFLIFFSLTMLLTGAIDHPGINYFISHKENLVYLAMLAIGIILIIKQETTGRIKPKNAR
jgi:prolipoprotein diacylglyceryltransferase